MDTLTSLHKIFKNCFYEVNLVSQYSHLEVILLSKVGSDIDADSGPHDFLTFIQIGSGYTTLCSENLRNEIRRMLEDNWGSVLMRA